MKARTPAPSLWERGALSVPKDRDEGPFHTLSRRPEDLELCLSRTNGVGSFYRGNKNLAITGVACEGTIVNNLEN